MSKLKTIEDLYKLLEKEYSWRIKELSIFKNLIRAEKDSNQKSLIRAGIALLYAHWEGFIKSCGDIYYSYVINQRRKLKEMNYSFMSISLRSKIEELNQSNKLEIHKMVLETIFQKQNEIAVFSSTSPIKTSNLKYDIFNDICILIGIDIDSFILRYKLKYDRDLKLTIDQDLVAQRNKIAHGEYLDINFDNFLDLYNLIINGVLYNFKELLMDCAQNKLYLKSKI
jgi:hypothetical protein